MQRSVVYLRFVINVEHFDPEQVVALEVVLNQDLGYPMRVEVVVDHLGLAQFLPLIALSLVQE